MADYSLFGISQAELEEAENEFLDALDTPIDDEFYDADFLDSPGAYAVDTPFFMEPPRPPPPRPAPEFESAYGFMIRQDVNPDTDPEMKEFAVYDEKSRQYAKSEFSDIQIAEHIGYIPNVFSIEYDFEELIDDPITGDSRKRYGLSSMDIFDILITIEEGGALTEYEVDILEDLIDRGLVRLVNRNDRKRQKL